jgi:hypothetical protein
MTIKFRSAIVLSSLLFVLSLHPAAKADMIHVVAGTDSATCAAIEASCLPVSFTANFMVTPPTFNGGQGGFFANVDFIESMIGTLNGFSAVGGSGGWLLPDNNYRPIFAIINFTADGLPWQIGFDDMISGDTFLSHPGGQVVSYLAWNATLVQTPEPSSLMLLLLGTGALLAGLALFKNKPCSY